MTIFSELNNFIMSCSVTTYSVTSNEQGYFDNFLFNVMLNYFEIKDDNLIIDITFCNKQDDLLIYKRMNEIDTNYEINHEGEIYILRMKIENFMIVFEKTEYGIIVTIYKYSKTDVFATPYVYNPTVVVINN